jgi:hypothetical protein
MGEGLATFVAHAALVTVTLALFGFAVIDGINHGDWRRTR